MFFSLSRVALSLLALPCFASPSMRTGLRATPEVTPGELRAQGATLEQFLTKFREIRKVGNIGAIWFSANGVAQACQGMSTIEWFQAVELMNDVKPTYIKAKFTPTWTGTECEYVLNTSLQPEAEVKSFFVGRSGFALSLMLEQLKLGVLKAKRSLEDPRSVTETFVLINSSSQQERPQLAYWAIVTSCPESVSAKTGEVTVNARDGQVSAGEWRTTQSCE